MANKTKKWEKPRCEKVRLVPEEAVLQNCKAIGGIIRAWFGNRCFWFFECRTVGS